MVSQQVAKLEQAFETTLLVRTTRSVRPTEEGRAFYERCAHILSQAQEAFHGLAPDERAPTGQLRLTAPFDYGLAVVIPAVAEFQRRYPSCTADVIISDRTLEPVEKDIELSIRVGWLADSGLRARRIGAFEQVLVGGPEFAARLGEEAEPERLLDVPFVANTILREPLAWTFTRDQEARSVRLSPALCIDATLGVLEAVRAGVGVSVLPDFTAEADLAGGRLVRLLPRWSLEAGGIYAVTPATRFRPARVKAFVDLLTERERQRAAQGRPRT
ncbi:MAG: LysR family transcriptional regulator [Caulobacterales bacterium]|nr:LysR family transcriptional regulator [Caulobacterales bacterium]